MIRVCILPRPDAEPVEVIEPQYAVERLHELSGRDRGLIDRLLRAANRDRGFYLSTNRKSQWRETTGTPGFCVRWRNYATPREVI